MTARELTQGGSQLFEVVVQTSLEGCALHLGKGTAAREIQIRAGSEGQVVVPVVSQVNLAVEGRVRVESPSRVLSVRAIHSAVQPRWASQFVRAIETPDIVDEESATKLRLAGGWAPRELIDGNPVRWVGSEAEVEFDPAGDASKLTLSGVVGPCLGRGASIDASSGGEILESQPLDYEDGQAFELQFQLKDLAEPGVVHFTLNRPRPRFTIHDVRVLNLLVKKVTLR